MNTFAAAAIPSHLSMEMDGHEPPSRPQPAVAGCQLLFLHELGASLCTAAADEHGGDLPRRTRHRPLQVPPHEIDATDRQPCGQPVNPFPVQILPVLGHQRRGGPRCHGPRRDVPRIWPAAPCGHLFLHVPGFGLLHRRLSRHDTGRARLRHLRPLRVVLPSIGGRPDRAFPPPAAAISQAPSV